MQTKRTAERSRAATVPATDAQAVGAAAGPERVMVTDPLLAELHEKADLLLHCTETIDILKESSSRVQRNRDLLLNDVVRILKSLRPGVKATPTPPRAGEVLCVSSEDWEGRLDLERRRVRKNRR